MRDSSGRKPASPASLSPSSRDAGPTVRARSAQGQPAAGPTIRPAPGTRGRPLIPIEAGAVKPRPRAGTTDPYVFWSDFYKTHDESPQKFRETLTLLNRSGKFTDVHAALLGYLTHRSRSIEPWMYEALALAIEMLKGKPEDVKQALNYAADLAQRSHNPNHLVSVADKLFLKGYYERVGPLLDEAATKVPHRSEPLAMSINLAMKTHDPKRMGQSIDRLLSLGWPGNDEYFRREARVQAERLAKVLREEGRGAEAGALLAGLPAAEARDVYIRLTWDGDADYDLIVQEPLGAQAQFSMPRTVFGGSIIRNGYGSKPEEVYVCPRGFDGDYTVRISQVYSNPNKPPTRLTLVTITHEGTAGEKKETHTLVPDDPKTRPVVVHLAGGRRKTVLPFLSPLGVLESGLAGPSGPAQPGERKKTPPDAAPAQAKRGADAAAKKADVPRR